MDIFLAALWFFVPAGIGNAAPIFAARLPRLRTLDMPIDFGMSWRGKRLLGDHKTWRGLAAGAIASTVVLWLQQYLVGHVVGMDALTVAIPHYVAMPTLILGPLLGLGALAGDAVESFFKRRRGTAPGQSWLPFDQIDYIIGAMLASLLVVILPWGVYLAAAVTWPVIHVASTYIGYFFRVKDSAI